MATNNVINSNIPIEIAKGGTAAASLTDHSVLVGSGTAAITAATVGTDGQLLIGAAGADPAFSSLTSTGGSITITPGANSLNIESVGGTGGGGIIGVSNLQISYDLTNPGYIRVFKSTGQVPNIAPLTASMIMPTSGTLSNFYVYRHTGTGTITHTVNVSGSNTALTATTTGIGTVSDNINTVAIVAGDYLCVEYSFSGSPSTTTLGSFSMVFTPS